MKNADLFDRRQILRTVMTASAAPFLFPLLGSRTEAAAATQNSSSPALAVVFHGLFAFLFGNRGEDISVVIPRVTGHVYWAGGFGHEDDNPLVQTNPLQLTGVKAGNWQPAFDFPYLPKTIQDESVVYTSMTIPWPDNLILDRLVAPLPNTNFFSQPVGFIPKNLPTIFAFVYNYGSIVQRPALSGTSWQAPRSWGQSGGATTAALHVRAEHCQMSMENGWDTFNSLFGLSSGSQGIVMNVAYGKSNPGAGTGIAGIVPANEEQFLSEEAQCISPPNPGTVRLNSAPVNCASMGGKK